MKYIKFQVLGSLLALTSLAYSFESCLDYPEVQKIRSKEIHEIYLSDQKDREDSENIPDEDLIKEKNERDTKRRSRIAEIYAEGCLKSASDYYDAAMVFQHGNVPDHYFQAFYFASRAYELGSEDAKWLKAAAIDRYLISIGHKQLFATQFYSSNEIDWCFCLQPVESNFPHELRIEATGKNIDDMLDMLDQLNRGRGQNCPKDFCHTELLATPKGTIPGFW